MGETTAVAHGLFAFAFGLAVGQASPLAIVTVRQARLNQWRRGFLWRIKLRGRASSFNHASA
ncbi:hypothetical protein [Moorena producens]|uniref:hypothetical protein n=1 Tax=Moorena producens TaxID=1155739 RepID=UPI003C7233CB